MKRLQKDFHLGCQHTPAAKISSTGLYKELPVKTNELLQSRVGKSNPAG